jgi:hypothetical protein
MAFILLSTSPSKPMPNHVHKIFTIADAHIDGHGFEFGPRVNLFFSVCIPKKFPMHIVAGATGK